MRTLTSHIVNPANEALEVTVEDEPGSGGANHLYRISGFNTFSNPADPYMTSHNLPGTYTTVLFQNGPIAEVGVNGITHEVLLAILEDRLAGFQAGPYACVENEDALTFIRAAQYALQKRTKERMARNVEGTHEL